MTTEEKAKRFDEVVEEFRGLLEGVHEDKCDIMEEDILKIVPELKISEDERIRKELLEHCKNQNEPYILTGNKCPQIQSWIAWLEKQGQNPVEWSDENKKIIDDIIEYLECFNDYDCGDEPYEEYYERFEKYIKFMESLKPQSHWKPSEEHIRYLQAVVNDVNNIGSESCSIALRDLLEQLKKL